MPSKSIDSFLRSTGQKLAGARRRFEKTQRELAREAKLSVRYLQSIEAGEVNLTLFTLLRVAKPLGVHPSALIPNAREWKWVRK